MHRACIAIALGVVLAAAAHPAFALCLADADCDDGDPCNGREYCDGFSCRRQLDPCSDGDFCTVDTCDPAAGCQHAARPACPVACTDDTDCDDGIRCNGRERCVTGACVESPAGDFSACLPDGIVCSMERCILESPSCGHDFVDDCCEPPGSMFYFPGIDSARCRVDVLAKVMGTLSPDKLGGTRAKARLHEVLGNARARIDAFQAGSHGGARRGLRLLGRFLRLVGRGLDKGLIAPSLGDELRSNAEEAEVGLKAALDVG